MNSLVLSAEYSDTMRHKAFHFHDCHQILYVTEGKIRITVSGKTYTASKGTIVLISRFEEHSIQVESSCYHRYALRIRPDINQSDLGFSLLVNRPENFQHTILLDKHSGADALMAGILKEYRADHPMKEKMLDLLLQQLLITILRAQPQTVPYREEEFHLVREVQLLFETNYQAEHSLEALSHQFHISQSHLSHLFKKVTGSSVKGYLVSCRFAAAKRYLAETDFEIGKIVELCGFSDSSNFSRSFKAVTGMTPSDFRNRFSHAQLFVTEYIPQKQDGKDVGQ